MSKQKLKKQETDNTPRRQPFAAVEGQEAFAAAWGYRAEVVKLAKRKGCPGFLAGNRIDPTLAIPAINRMLQVASALPDGIASPQDWLATEKAKRESIKRQQDEKSVIPTADAERANAAAWGFVFAEIDRLCNELPPAAAGLSALEIFKRLTAFRESMRKSAKAKFEEASK
jgi:hypothetical protein